MLLKFPTFCYIQKLKSINLVTQVSCLFCYCNRQESHPLRLLKLLSKKFYPQISSQISFSLSSPFTLIEETFVIGCFHGWEAKFAKINSTKKDFHDSCTEKFMRKIFLPVPRK